jgi:hypothetical protein
MRDEEETRNDERGTMNLFHSSFRVHRSSFPLHPAALLRGDYMTGKTSATIYPS